MSMYVETELEVCVVCAHLIANGEYDDDGTDAALIASMAMVDRWADRAADIVLGGDELGFRLRPCDACGSELAGDRFTAGILTPTA
jgi:hypothetical protein